MKLRKNKKDKNVNEFDLPQKISSGNLYEIYEALKAQKNIDLSSIPEFNKIGEKFKSKLKALTKVYIDDKSIPDYYLFQLHANYFVNTIVYKCNNWAVNDLIQKIIRYAWINGKAGVYFDTSINKYFGIIINNIETNMFGEIERIDYWPLAFSDNVASFEEVQKKPLLSIKGKKECDKVAIFKWGTAAISAWILYWPFVKLQNMLLKMISTQALAYNKKYIYKVLNPDADLSEMELWFDPLNIFLINASGANLSNKFEINDTSGGDTGLDFITFYKELCGCYYALFGRRMNLDFKRERNTVEEVSMTSGSIENLERDWYTQFLIFVEQFKDINKKYNLIENLEIDEIRLNNWIREERLQGDIEEHDNSIKPNNQGEK